MESWGDGWQQRRTAGRMRRSSRSAQGAHRLSRIPGKAVPGCKHTRNHAEHAPRTDEAATPQVMDVNVNGVLFTAQAAGRQMAKFGNGGSIILIASMSGSITNRVSRVSFCGCS